MTDSALSKVDRAAKHVGELNDLFREHRPFAYVVETHTQTGKRATFAKRNEAVIADAANIAADIVHNLRTALDHAYWQIVSPFAKTPKEQRAVQFPFSETAARLDEAVKNRLANRVSPSFCKILIDLKPHGDPGGNELLYLVHQMDALDKHRFPIPTGDYTRISSDAVRSQVPDFPSGLTNCHFGSNRRDVGWTTPPSVIPRLQIGGIRPPTLYEFELKLEVPVEIVFSVGPDALSRPVIPTLYQLVDVTRMTIETIRSV